MPSTIGYLLDTNVLVALIRANPLGKSIDQRFDLRSSMSRCMISIVTVGETLSLVRQFGWGTAKQEVLKSILEEVVAIDINHPAIFDAYAEIDYASHLMGRKMGKNDVWIAATAHVSNTTLLTTDLDFEHLHESHIDRVWIDPILSKSN